MKKKSGLTSVAGVICLSMLFTACADKKYKAQSPMKKGPEVEVAKASPVFGMDGNIKSGVLESKELYTSLNTVGAKMMEVRRNLIANESLKLILPEGADVAVTCSVVGNPSDNRTAVSQEKNLAQVPEVQDALTGELASLDLLTAELYPMSGLKVALSESVLCVTTDGDIELAFDNKLENLEYIQGATIIANQDLSKLKSEIERADALMGLFPNGRVEMIIKEAVNPNVDSEIVFAVKKSAADKIRPELVGKEKDGSYISTIQASKVLASMAAKDKGRLVLLSVEKQEDLEMFEAELALNKVETGISKEGYMPAVSQELANRLNEQRAMVAQVRAEAQIDIEKGNQESIEIARTQGLPSSDTQLAKVEGEKKEDTKVQADQKITYPNNVSDAVKK